MGMKRLVLLALSIPFAFSAPTSAAEKAPPNSTEAAIKITATYMDCFNKQDAACIAALYTRDGKFINPDGKHEVLIYYTEAFKAGLSKLVAQMEEAWPIDADTLLAMGRFHVNGKNDKDEPIALNGVWTSTNIIEDGGWKILMMTVAPKPPEQKAAAKERLGRGHDK